MASKIQAPLLPPCKVCGEASTGFHYGVNTCGGCKGFFGRALVRSDGLRCVGNGTCDIVAQGKRKRVCQKCRYEKCLKVGMSKVAIKTGRYSYSKKSQDTIELNEYLADTGKEINELDFVLLPEKRKKGSNEYNQMHYGINEDLRYSKTPDNQNMSETKPDNKSDYLPRRDDGVSHWLPSRINDIPRLYEKHSYDEHYDLQARDFSRYDSERYPRESFSQASHDHSQSSCPDYHDTIHRSNEDMSSSQAHISSNNHFRKSDIFKINEGVNEPCSSPRLPNESYMFDHRHPANEVFENQSMSCYFPDNETGMMLDSNSTKKDNLFTEKAHTSKESSFRNTGKIFQTEMSEMPDVNRKCPQRQRVSILPYPSLVATSRTHKNLEDPISYERTSSDEDAEICLDLSPSSKSTLSEASTYSSLPDTPSDIASASTPDRHHSPNLISIKKSSLSASPSLLRTFSATHTNIFSDNNNEKVFASSFDTSDCSMFFSRLFVQEMDQLLPIMAEEGGEGTQLSIVPVKRRDCFSFMVQLKREGVCSTFYLPPANAKTASRADILTLDELDNVATEKKNVPEFRSEFDEDDLMTLVEQIVESHNKHVKCDTNSVDPDEFESVVSTCHKTCMAHLSHGIRPCTVDFDTYQKSYEQTGNDLDGRRTMYKPAVLMLETTIVKAVRFFKGIPGVQKMLSLEDQTGLIKGGMQEYLMLAGYKGRDVVRRVQLDAELNHLQCEHDMGKLFPQYHVDAGFKVAGKLQKLDLRLLEIIVLKAMAISSPDTDYIKAHSALGQFYWKLVNCLLLLLHRTGRSKLFPSIIEALMELKEYSHCCWKWCLHASDYLNHVQLELTPLLKETFFAESGSGS